MSQRTRSRKRPQELLTMYRTLLLFGFFARSSATVCLVSPSGIWAVAVPSARQTKVIAGTLSLGISWPPSGVE